MGDNRACGRRAFAAVAGAVALLLTQFLAPTASAALPTTVPPVLSRSSKVVTADALPTVQIDGVVWSQAMTGNTVYAAGEFTNARPAGAAPGTSTTPRKNLLAYSVTSGKLNTTFKPKAFNGPIRAVAVSADGKKVYVGGGFTRVGTAKRQYFAALDARTGALLAANPAFNSRVNALAVVGANVYVGGWFNQVGQKARSRLAAVNGSTGRLTSWAPVASDGVNALVATPDKKKIVAGGIFSKISGTWAYGMGAISIATGKPSTWKVNKVVRDAGQHAAILSLAADADTVYGTGYAYGGGNFEGTFAADPKDGSIRWLQDCHGDSYSVAPVGGTIYVVGHAHYCANIGGFPDTYPRTHWQRALAMTRTARGTVATNGQSGPHYGNFAGQPAPSLYNWFPDFSIGTYTKQNQAAWSIVGNSSYIAVGGEFPSVNGAPQQGLVRFAVAGKATQRRGPELSDESTAPQASAAAAGGVQLTWQTNSDQDDRTLSYQVLRDGDAVSPVMKQAATFWDRKTMTWADTAVTAGVTYRYAIRATDAAGNTVDSPVTSYAVPAPTSVDPDPEAGGETLPEAEPGTGGPPTTGG